MMSARSSRSSAAQALGVDAQVGDGFFLGFIGGGQGEALAGLFGGSGDGVGVALDGEGEEIGFEHGDAVESPEGVGEGLDQVGFGVYGFYVMVGVEVLVGQDDDLAGEAVAEGVERRAAFALLSFGSGGVLGVGAVDFGAFGRRHIMRPLSVSEYHRGELG